MTKHHKLASKAVLAASVSLLSASVIAATNGPVRVESQNSGFETLLENRLQAMPVVQSNQRYIVKFKKGAIGPGGERLMKNGDALSAQRDANTGDLGNDVALNAVQARNTISNAGGETVSVIARQHLVAAKLSKKALNALRNDPTIESVSVDAKRKLMAQSTPYGIPMVEADQFAQSNTSARKVCIIDTGYNLGHPDLPDTNNGVTGEGNNSQVGNWYNDGNGHGTHVAGTISAYDNSEGVIGVYPGVDMHIVKIFDDNGQWTYSSDIIQAVQQCQDAGSNVVNMSLGGGSSSSAEESAMQGFADDGVLLVAAAGNDGNSVKSYPASYDAVMSVGAVGSNESWANYSQYNNQVEIAAPGTSVNSTYPDDTYAALTGTSMATPHVAGGAALVWSYFTQCSADDIRSALTATAEDKGAAGRDNYYGYGLMKLEAAYDYLNTNGCDGSSGGGDNGGGDGGVEPVSGQLTNLSGSRNAWDRYTWDVPEGVTTMTVEISGGSGDADLYMRLGSEPTLSTFECRPYNAGNDEICTISAPQSGTWHIGIHGYSSYNGVTMDYSYE
ncbi:S8 family serine peptidase [Alteromonas halophila]|uniref:Peptidase S8 n=1 Tax=Alteromonas halophila TaxID=516698 RepID=A0A918MXS9_9ALTE|nr:S8 family serine peptidase [Alteromonas halophila]GGW82561.1 hypothetical protein GCM10007391_14550 [Alteromonas halophila]